MLEARASASLSLPPLNNLDTGRPGRRETAAQRGVGEATIGLELTAAADDSRNHGEGDVKHLLPVDAEAVRARMLSPATARRVVRCTQPDVLGPKPRSRCPPFPVWTKLESLRPADWGHPGSRYDPTEGSVVPRPPRELELVRREGSNQRNVAKRIAAGVSALIVKAIVRAASSGRPRLRLISSPSRTNYIDVRAVKAGSASRGRVCRERKREWPGREPGLLVCGRRSRRPRAVPTPTPLPGNPTACRPAP